MKSAKVIERSVAWLIAAAVIVVAPLTVGWVLPGPKTTSGVVNFGPIFLGGPIQVSDWVLLNTGYYVWPTMPEGSPPFISVAGSVRTQNTNLPPQWFASRIGALMNGGLCGQTDWVFSSTTSFEFIQSIVSPCGDPAGQQSMQAGIIGAVWNGNQYEVRGPQYTPIYVH